jgi:hypothetical protein
MLEYLVEFVLCSCHIGRDGVESAVVRGKTEWKNSCGDSAPIYIIRTCLGRAVAGHKTMPASDPIHDRAPPLTAVEVVESAVKVDEFVVKVDEDVL